MAFCNKLGSLVRQSISQNGQAPSMFNAIRCMSTSKLFVGGLSFGTNDDSLKDAFSGYGAVTEARVITDRETGKSRGFGFVNFSSTEEASQAISAMDGQELHGRNIRVSYANERTERPGGGGGGPRAYNSRSRNDGGDYGY